jgi:hypothetical protein
MKRRRAADPEQTDLRPNCRRCIDAQRAVPIPYTIDASVIVVAVIVVIVSIVVVITVVVLVVIIVVIVIVVLVVIAAVVAVVIVIATVVAVVVIVAAVVAVVVIVAAVVAVVIIVTTIVAVVVIVVATTVPVVVFESVERVLDVLFDVVLERFVVSGPVRIDEMSVGAPEPGPDVDGEGDGCIVPVPDGEGRLELDLFFDVEIRHVGERNGIAAGGCERTESPDADVFRKSCFVEKGALIVVIPIEGIDFELHLLPGSGTEVRFDEDYRLLPVEGKIDENGAGLDLFTGVVISVFVATVIAFGTVLSLKLDLTDDQFDAVEDERIALFISERQRLGVRSRRRCRR